MIRGIDTGADQNVIHSRRLADYGLATYAKSASTGGGGSAEYDYAEGATFTLPGVEVRDQHVAVLDQSGLERALGVPLGGILGYDFISRFVFEIDYDAKLITLHDPRTWRYSGSGFPVPITFDAGIPFTSGTISVPTRPAIPAYFILDFGAAETMTLTSPFVKANSLASLSGTNAGVNRPVGLEGQFFAQNNMRGHIDRLTLGGLAGRNRRLQGGRPGRGPRWPAAAEVTLGDLRDRLSHQGEQHHLEIARGNEKIALAIEVRLVSLDRK